MSEDLGRRMDKAEERLDDHDHRLTTIEVTGQTLVRIGYASMSLLGIAIGAIILK